MNTFMFLGFGIHAWITIVTVLTMFTILLFTKWRTDFVFLAAVGVLSVIAMRKLLPDRKVPETAFEQTREYTVELLVPSDNPYIGQTLGEAGLLHVKGGSLIEIYHFDKIPTPITEDEPIMGGRPSGVCRTDRRAGGAGGDLPICECQQPCLLDGG